MNHRTTMRAWALSLVLGVGLPALFSEAVHAAGADTCDGQLRQASRRCQGDVNLRGHAFRTGVGSLSVTTSSTHASTAASTIGETLRRDEATVELVVRLLDTQRIDRQPGALRLGVTLHEPVGLLP
jgi:hypothetical protein